MSEENNKVTFGEYILTVTRIGDCSKYNNSFFRLRGLLTLIPLELAVEAGNVIKWTHFSHLLSSRVGGTQRTILQKKSV